MKKLLLLLLFIILPLALNAQSINGRFSSSVYSFERFENKTSSTTYLRSFQTLNLNINKGNVSLRTRFNLEADIAKKMINEPRLRFYNLYLEVRNIWDVATVKLGRQSLINSVAGGVFDGVNLKLKHSGYSLSGFYGGNVPAYQKLEITDDWKNDYVLGGKFVITALKNFRLAALYIDKNFKQTSYVATRIDAQLNPIQVLIEKASNQYKYLSGEASYNLPKLVNLNVRYDYDLNFNITSKFSFSGRYDKIENLGISVYYNYRQPKIRYNSIFSVFNYGNSQEVEGGLDYKLSRTFTVVGKFANVSYKDDNSQRFTVGVNSKYGNFSYRKTFGYAGELDALSLYSARSFLEGLITPSVGISYASYKLTRDSERNSITTVLAGLNYRPWRLASFDIQGQYLQNKIYKNDFRVFFKFNFWFNSNLNVI